MQRRHFFQSVITVLVAGQAVACALTPPTASVQILANPDLLTFLGNDDLIRLLGNEYRSLYPDESTVPAITTALMANARLSPRQTDSMLRERLAEIIRSDFAEANTVQLQGWVLARTEARQCALFSMLYP